jgi:hypothetical protein
MFGVLADAKDPIEASAYTHDPAATAILLALANYTIATSSVNRRDSRRILSADVCCSLIDISFQLCHNQFLVSTRGGANALHTPEQLVSSVYTRNWSA